MQPSRKETGKPWAPPGNSRRHVYSTACVGPFTLRMCGCPSAKTEGVLHLSPRVEPRERRQGCQVAVRTQRGLPFVSQCRHVSVSLVPLAVRARPGERRAARKVGTGSAALGVHLRQVFRERLGEPSAPFSSLQAASYRLMLWLFK